MDVTIIVSTFGSSFWLNEGNATASIAERVFNLPVVRVHGGTLALARNTGAHLANSEWLCFLDAGDVLHVDYFEEMEKASGDLRAPRLFFSTGGRAAPYEPYDLRLRDMNYSNQCVIGTLIRKSTFHDVGEFWEEPAYEDWSLFRRAWLCGASIEHTQAIYYAIQRANSRNQVDDPLALINEIKRTHEEWLE